MPADAVVHKIAIADGELSDLEWHSIAQARSLELPNITRVVLEDLGERIAAGALANRTCPCRSITGATAIFIATSSRADSQP